jgi:hypothetical protein
VSISGRLRSGMPLSLPSKNPGRVGILTCTVPRLVISEARLTRNGLPWDHVEVLLRRGIALARVAFTELCTDPDRPRSWLPGRVWRLHPLSPIRDQFNQSRPPPAGAHSAILLPARDRPKSPSCINKAPGEGRFGGPSIRSVTGYANRRCGPFWLEPSSAARHS